MINLFFSIIVPIYNSEAYLKECIESVLNQTCNDYELILINDGSTDKSCEIIDPYLSQFPENIKVVHKENGGQFSARKEGIGLSCGDYIISLDSDDCLRRDSLQILKKYITDAHHPDILFHRISTTHDFSTPLINFDFCDGEIFEGDSLKKIYELTITTQKLNSFYAKAYKSSLLKNIVWDDEIILSLRRGEDLMQVLPVISAAKKMVYCPEILYYYRTVETSISHQYCPNLFEAKKILYVELKKYSEIWGLNNNSSVNSKLNSRYLIELLSVISQSYHSDFKTCNDVLSKICDDTWFRSLYKSVNKKELTFRRKFTFYLLYHKKLNLLYRILKAFNSIN